MTRPGREGRRTPETSNPRRPAKPQSAVRYSGRYRSVRPRFRSTEHHYEYPIPCGGQWWTPGSTDRRQITVAQHLVKPESHIQNFGFRPLVDDDDTTDTQASRGIVGRFLGLPRQILLDHNAGVPELA